MSEDEVIQERDPFEEAMTELVTPQRVESIKNDVPECDYCGGTGERSYKVCPDCKGVGKHVDVVDLLVFIADQYDRMKTLRTENAQLRARSAEAEQGVLSFLRSDRVRPHVAEAMEETGRGDYGMIDEDDARRFVNHLAEHLGWQRLG